jgi:type IV secretory pathway TraG/TraD family ATPase VirD4
MFIGSNDMNTCKEYSELCGNITVVTSSQSGSIHSSDINLSTQTQVRPLIYPSDLQRLNKPGDIGHSIIVTFGNYPLKTYFTPSFKVPFYKIGKMDTSELAERFFDENEVFYSADARNKIVFNTEEKEFKEIKATNEKTSETTSEKSNETTASAENSSTTENTQNKTEESESSVEVSATKEDNAKNELISEFDLFKQNNPEGTLQEFYVYLANKINEGNNEQEK